MFYYGAGNFREFKLFSDLDFPVAMWLVPFDLIYIRISNEEMKFNDSLHDTEN